LISLSYNETTEQTFDEICGSIPIELLLKYTTNSAHAN